jgi:hypothetical protein
MNHILIISAATCWIVGFYSTNSLGDTRMKILVATIFGIMISYRLKQNRDTESDDSSISEIVDAP